MIHIYTDHTGKGGAYPDYFLVIKSKDQAVLEAEGTRIRLNSISRYGKVNSMTIEIELLSGETSFFRYEEGELFDVLDSIDKMVGGA